MPTGYTANMMESGQSFSEFAMQCARAFGACVEMRDESMDAPIPESFLPSDYHAKQILKSTAELARLEAMTDAERITYGESAKRETVDQMNLWVSKERLENERLLAMEKEVAAWEPPSKEHVGLKNFMLEQISISKSDMGYLENRIAEEEARSALDYYFPAVENAKNSIKYNTEQQSKDAERAKGRTQWVRQLRDSLSTVTTT